MADAVGCCWDRGNSIGLSCAVIRQAPSLSSIVTLSDLPPPPPHPHTPIPACLSVYCLYVCPLLAHLPGICMRACLYACLCLCLHAWLCLWPSLCLPVNGMCRDSRGRKRQGRRSLCRPFVGARFCGGGTIRRGHEATVLGHPMPPRRAGETNQIHADQHIEQVRQTR